MRALASIARELELGSALKIGKGEEVTGGRDNNMKRKKGINKDYFKKIG